MSMLAEPRRKQKISSDPRGLNWSNDDNKFGQKLMEKMGWEKGRGLGANQDGNVDHIAVPYKHDTRGVGCSKSYEDNWIAHQDDFNNLLSELNQAACGNTEDTVQNLEEKSKTSKGRLHYQKFARGKDLSSAKHGDLDSIMGRRKIKSNPSTPQVQSEANSEDEAQAQRIAAADNFYNANTISTGVSVNDYFTRQMAELKARAAGKTTSETNNNNSENDEDYTEVQDKNSHKKKKKKRKIEVDSGVEDSLDASPDVIAKKKKKKKSKEVDCESPVNEDIESSTVKRKKKKKSKKDTSDQDDDGVESVEGVKQKKKKSKGKMADSTSQVDEISITPEDSQKGEDDSGEISTSTTDKFYGITTISSGVNINDYFANKMAEKKAKIAENQNVQAFGNKPDIKLDESGSNSFAHKMLKIADCESLLNSGTSSVPKNKNQDKKKDKSIKSDIEPSAVNNDELSPQVEATNIGKKKKSKKNKSEAIEDSVSLLHPEQETKKKKRKRLSDMAETIDHHDVEECEPKRRKKKQRKMADSESPDEVEDEFISNEDEPEPKQRKKSKSKITEAAVIEKSQEKKKKRKVESPENSSSSDDSAPSQITKSKKSKMADDNMIDVPLKDNDDDESSKSAQWNDSKLASLSSIAGYTIEALHTSTPNEAKLNNNNKLKMNNTDSLIESKSTKTYASKLAGLSSIAGYTIEALGTRVNEEKAIKNTSNNAEAPIQENNSSKTKDSKLDGLSSIAGYKIEAFCPQNLEKVKKEKRTKKNESDSTKNIVTHSTSGKDKIVDSEPCPESVCSQNLKKPKKEKKPKKNDTSSTKNAVKLSTSGEDKIVDSESSPESSRPSKLEKPKKEKKAKKNDIGSTENVVTRSTSEKDKIVNSEPPSTNKSGEKVKKESSKFIDNLEGVKEAAPYLKYKPTMKEHSPDNFVSKIFPGSNLDTVVGYGDGKDIGFGPGRGLLKEKLLKKL